MAIIGQDSFARPNQSGWGTATDGQVWTQFTGAETLSIVNNQGQATGNIGVDNWIGMGTKQVLDVDCRFRFSVTDNSNTYPGVMLRGNGAATTGATTAYRVHFDNQKLAFRRINAGATTNIGVDTSFSVTNGQYYWIRVSINGNILKGKIWADSNPEPAAWTTINTDSNPITTPGYFGIYSGLTVTSTIIITYDYFTATDLDLSGTLTEPRWTLRAITGAIFKAAPSVPLPAWVDRAITANFVRQTSPTNIPRYVPRGLMSTLANYATNITTRFRLMSANVLNDISTRFILVGGTQQLKDIATRLRLMQQSVQDVTTRFRLKSADQLKDIASRFRLMQQSVRDIATRFRLMSANQLKDVASRFRLMSASQLKDISTRFRLRSADQLKDIVSRFRLMSASQLKDIATRLRLMQQSIRDVSARFRLMSVSQLKDIRTRLRLRSADQLRDIATRFRLSTPGGQSLRDVATRFILSAVPDAIWVTRDMRMTWKTRDDLAAWKTRDDLASFNTRDDKDTWTTRDDKATWTTRR